MVIPALKACLVYFVIYVIETNLLSWQTLTRPIVLGPIVGLVLGDIKTGIILGASLESIFMGVSAVGGALPSDWATSTVIVVSYAILTGQNAEAGLALAIPIGTIVVSLGAIWTPVTSGLAPHWEKLAAEGKTRKLFNQTFLQFVVQALWSTVLMFFAIAYGVEGLSAFMATLPAWVMTGLGAASSLMIGIGISILTSMIWSPKVGVFFFLGFVMAKSMGLSTIAIAIIGIVIAVAIFMQDKDVIDLKNSLGKGSQSSKEGEGGFFA
ncbi:MAG TPA: PTS sugar transporter subunit IIC [Clostridiales bacterium]|jgi:PTS system mannose-specific IIC component/fructoselysine and glucoselysine-specific PTS system IIC component|nr:PTS sugar transporter subunit IIC [Clostridiales bacterium]